MGQLTPETFISSLTNAKIKRTVRLRDRRYRDQQGQTIIEGFRELKQALHGEHPLMDLFFCPHFFLGNNEEALLRDYEKRGTKLIETSEAVFEKISYRDRPDGLLGIGGKIGVPLSTIEFRNAKPFILVAEAIEKPGNLGSMLRSADGVNLDAVIVCEPKTDINNPNVVRASVGTLFRVPIVQTSREATMTFLRHHGIQWVATSPKSGKTYWQVDFNKPIAIVVGSEQYGLDNHWFQHGESVRIPMLGSADSLNVATSASLLLYEAVHQRQG